jgi:hypothetical protein
MCPGSCEGNGDEFVGVWNPAFLLFRKNYWFWVLGHETFQGFKLPGIVLSFCSSRVQFYSAWHPFRMNEVWGRRDFEELSEVIHFLFNNGKEVRHCEERGEDP